MSEFNSVLERLRAKRNAAAAASASAAAAEVPATTVVMPSEGLNPIATTEGGSSSAMALLKSAGLTPSSVPPAYNSAPHAVLMYRDRKKDPLSAIFTASTAIQLLAEVCDRRAGQKRPRSEAPAHNTSADVAGIKELPPSVEHFAEVMLPSPLSVNAEVQPTPSQQHTIFTDVSYARQCAEATVDSTGLQQPACRSVDHYRRRDRIAEGVYGVVFSATCVDEDGKAHSPTSTQKLYALKHIKKQWLLERSADGFAPFFLREFDLLLRLHHPNIVSTREIVLLGPTPPPHQRAAAQETKNDTPSPPTVAGGASGGGTLVPKDVFVVMNHCPWDLKDYMMRYCRKTNLPFLHISSRVVDKAEARRHFLARAKSIAYQMFEGIAFMHDHRIMHRDLKTSNLLVDADGLVKIADFGLGRLYREGQGLTPTVATLNYRAPELHFGVIDYSHTMDVWSAGCIMAELFIKRPLFTGSSEVAHLQKVCNILGIPNDEVFPGVFKLPKVKEALRQLSSWNRESKLGETLRGGGGSSTTDDAASLTDAGLDLFQKVFQWCPARRPSARDVLRHPFFTTEEPLPCSPSELVWPIPVAIQHTHASAPSDNTQSSSSTRHHARQQRNSGGSAPPPLVHHGDDGDVQKDGGSVVSGDAKRAEVEDREDSHSRVEVEEGTEDCASPFELSNTRSNPPTTTA